MDEPTCWCGGEVGERDPGDESGLGCLENIYHDWHESVISGSYTLSWVNRQGILHTDCAGS